MVAWLASVASTIASIWARKSLPWRDAGSMLAGRRQYLLEDYEGLLQDDMAGQTFVAQIWVIDPDLVV